MFETKNTGIKGTVKNACIPADFFPASYSWEQVQIARRKMHGAESYHKLKHRKLSKLEIFRLNKRQVSYLPLKVRASS